MGERSTGKPNQVAVTQAAEMLGITADAVTALARAGYLAGTATAAGGLEFKVGDLKAFLARNADNGAGNLFLVEASAVDPEELLDALDGKSEEMARRAFHIFSSVFPEAAAWTLSEQARFIEQARSRFEAILAVTSQGAEVDEALVGDLQEVGANAASSGSPLPHILAILRISRDLVVQTAVELAEDRGRQWSMALSLVLTRVLPAMDRLTDALARGYWSALVRREEEHGARYGNVVEHSSDGVYEVDLDGRVTYANAAFALIVGRRPEQVAGAHLADLLRAVDPPGAVERLTAEAHGGQRLQLGFARTDGVRRLLDVRTLARAAHGEVVGFQGVVQDVTAARNLEADKNKFLELVTSDLRQPLTAILGLGATLESHASEMPADSVRRAGGAVRRQAERISRLADDLSDLSRLESQSLLLSPRSVELWQVVDAALATCREPAGIDVDIPLGIEVHADPRRLEQVVANLVDNALAFGARPVQVSAAVSDGSVEVTVLDHGPGVPEAIVPTLFTGLRTVTRRPGGDEKTRLGLALVRGLVELMGGRIRYERPAGAGACFRLTLPAARTLGL